nr:hypothetical protein [Nanoarchaeota archaeon]
MVGYPPTAFLYDVSEKWNKEYKQFKKEFQSQGIEQIRHYLNNRTFPQKLKGLGWFSTEKAKKTAAKEVLEEKLKIEKFYKD